MGPAVLIVASLAFTAFQAIQQQNAAVSAAEAEQKAAAENDKLTQAELARQQGEVNKRAADDKSDRIRRAEKELAFLQVAGADAGSGAMTMAQRVSELGFVEGSDLSRLESNRNADVEGLQAEKQASRQGVTNTTVRARNESKAATTQAGMQIAGAAISAGASAYGGGLFSKGAGVSVGGYTPTSATRNSSNFGR